MPGKGEKKIKNRICKQVRGVVQAELPPAAAPAPGTRLSLSSHCTNCRNYDFQRNVVETWQKALKPYSKLKKSVLRDHLQKAAIVKQLCRTAQLSPGKCNRLRRCFSLMHSVMLFQKASIFIILEQQLWSNTQKLVSTLLKVLRAADEGNLVVVMTCVQVLS